VVLTQDALLAHVTVTPDEVRAQYANAAKTYTQDEQRDAAHILIAVKPDESDTEKAAQETSGGARRAGEGEPGEVRRPRPAVLTGPRLRPARGRAWQQSARHDGQPFDDAVFAMKIGEIPAGAKRVRLARDR
jgi:hypothetical protein